MNNRGVLGWQGKSIDIYLSSPWLLVGLLGSRRHAYILISRHRKNLWKLRYSFFFSMSDPRLAVDFCLCVLAFPRRGLSTLFQRLVVHSTSYDPEATDGLHLPLPSLSHLERGGSPGTGVLGYFSQSPLKVSCHFLALKEGMFQGHTAETCVSGLGTPDSKVSTLWTTWIFHPPGNTVQNHPVTLMMEKGARH